MPMDDVNNVKSCIDDCLYRPALVSQFIIIVQFNGIFSMFKNTIALSLANVESQTSSWIY